MVSGVRTPQGSVPSGLLEEHFSSLYGEQDVLEQWLQQTFDDLEAWQAELAEQAEKLSRERAELESARSAMMEQKTQNVQSTAIAGELQSTQEKLLAAQAELASLKKQIAADGRQAALHENERLEHQEQYAALELELEHVRNRASDASDTLIQTRFEWDRERANWKREKEELQRLLHRQQSQLQSRSTDMNANAQETLAVNVDTDQALVETVIDAQKDATVVGSVMAQFERIRSERAVRRRKTTEGG